MSRRSALAGAGLLAAALLLSACGGSGYGSTAASGQSTSKTTAAPSGATVQLGKTDVGTVLVDTRGRTLYAFADDAPGTSNCSGSCLQYWPPAAATTAVSHASGVTAKLATIQRSDGTTQLTVNGWPVYTYVGDSGPGKAAGQGLDLSGGLWCVLAPTGSQIKSTGNVGATGTGGY